MVDSLYGRIPSSITYFEDLLQRATSMDEKHLLFALVVGECARAGNRDAEVHFLRRQVAELPSQPILLASLAHTLAGDPTCAGEARALSEEAVKLAQSQGRQVRYSLTCKARVALQVGDYGMLSEALRSLVADADCERAEDTGYEFDFLDQIDPGRVDSALLQQYRALSSP